MMTTRELYPLVLVDIALFTVDQGQLRVLLVKRSQEPEAKRWALPGGILKPDIDGSLEAAARRVLRTKVSVDVPHIEEVRTFSGAKRDPRGWSVAVLFYALLPRDKINELVRSKIEAVKWADAAHTGHPLAFDHAVQLIAALETLRAKIGGQTLPLHLLPEKFTLTELQVTCEAISGRPLDKGAFRRRLKSSTELVPIDEFVRGAQRPAQLHVASADFRF
jgi:ADP-ribose pyrophosphatase YjhB (NUDIX family)